MEYVWQIADDLGVENIYLGNLFIGGCTLDTHALNAKNNNLAYAYRVNSNGSWKTESYRMGDALSEQNWDVYNVSLRFQCLVRRKPLFDFCLDVKFLPRFQIF